MKGKRARTNVNKNGFAIVARRNLFENRSISFASEEMKLETGKGSVWTFGQHAVWIKQASIISVSLGDYSLYSLSLPLFKGHQYYVLSSKFTCIVHIVYSRWVTTIRTKIHVQSILCVYQPAKKIYFHARENNFNYFERNRCRVTYFSSEEKKIELSLLYFY